MFLRLYLVISSLALVVLTTAAFRQAARPQNLGEMRGRDACSWERTPTAPTVDASGNPRIEFLDENGKIVDRIPQGGK